MQSEIFMNEEVSNLERRFGSNKKYYPAMVVTKQGDDVPALFTADQLQTAIDRASSNPEDLPPEERSLWDWLVGK